jgi:hypothetical protein
MCHLYWKKCFCSFLSRRGHWPFEMNLLGLLMRFDVFLAVCVWLSNCNATQMLLEANSRVLVQRFRRTYVVPYSKSPIYEECRFRNVKHCSPAETYRHFLGTSCLHLLLWTWWQHVSTNSLWLPTKLQGITSQKTAFLSLYA